MSPPLYGHIKKECSPLYISRTSNPGFSSICVYKLRNNYKPHSNSFRFGCYSWCKYFFSVFWFDTYASVTYDNCNSAVLVVFSFYKNALIILLRIFYPIASIIKKVY